MEGESNKQPQPGMEGLTDNTQHEIEKWIKIEERTSAAEKAASSSKLVRRLCRS